MKRNVSPGRRLAHLWLLVAALLQFGAVTLGPWAHLVAADLAGGPAWAAPDDAPAGGAPHHEGDCALCHTAATAALLPAESVAAPFLLSTEVRIQEPARVPLPPSVGSPSARSPPLA